MNNNRCRQYLVAPELFVNMCQGTYKVTADALPDDARVVRAGYERSMDVFYITVESSEFAEVPDGGVIPVFDGPMIQRLNQLQAMDYAS